MIKKIICPEDIAIGDVVEFYIEGLRSAIVEKITKSKKSKKVTIHTERYGSVPFEKIVDVLEYKNGRTVRKNLMSDIFE